MLPTSITMETNPAMIQMGHTKIHWYFGDILRFPLYIFHFGEAQQACTPLFIFHFGEAQQQRMPFNKRLSGLHKTPIR